LFEDSIWQFIANFIYKKIIKVKLFADDVKMHITILDDMDIQRLQLAVDALVQW